MSKTRTAYERKDVDLESEALELGLESKKEISRFRAQVSHRSKNKEN